MYIKTIENWTRKKKKYAYFKKHKAPKNMYNYNGALMVHSLLHK